MKKIIYIYPNTSSFVKNDISFLKKKYKVVEQKLNWGSVFMLPFNLILQLLFLLRHIYSTHTIIVNFGGYFSLLPALVGKLFNVKTFIILNGTDSVSFPRYNYGSLRKPLLRFFIKKSYKNATKLFPVDGSLLIQNYTFDEKVMYPKQGITVFFPNLRTPVEIIPNGFDIDFWNFDTKKDKQKDFLTVISTNNKATAIFKGVDLIIKTATLFPNKEFTIVGLSKELQQKFEHPNNVFFHPFLQKEKLRKLYQKHQFYLQLSANEGFGCSVAEAMLCGCIPLVSNAGALPEVVGKAGFIVKKRTVENVFKTINNALNLLEIHSKRLEARQRIVEDFAISKRERLFLQEIESVI